MPQAWLIDAPPPGHALPGAAMAALFDAAEHVDPAGRLLAAVNTIAPVQYLSLVAYAAGDRGEAPRLAGREAARSDTCGRDVTTECFEIYRRRYWRSDETTRIADRMRDDGGTPPVVVLRLRADDVPLAGWRHEIYEREGLADRLTFVYLPRTASPYAINLYRDRTQGRFARSEIDRLVAVAPLMRRAHQASLRLALPAPGEATPTVARARAAIAAAAPELSPRELEVCAWIACGVGADGIACELDVAPSTITTLRKRAYAKLAARGLGGGRLRLARLAGC